MYKATADLVERCPTVIDLVGEPMERKGMVKGKMASGVADMRFAVKGPKGQVEIALRGTLREGSKTEYDLETITARTRSKEEEKFIPLYENGAPVVAFLDRSSSGEVAASTEGTEASDKKDAATTDAAKPQQNGFLLNKPWYYRVGLAVAAGAVMGIVLSLMIMSSRQGPKSSSAYQSLMVLLRENKIAQDVLGDNVSAVAANSV